MEFIHFVFRRIILNVSVFMESFMGKFVVLKNWTLFVLCLLFVEKGHSQHSALVYSDAELTATVIESDVTVIETIDKTTMYLVEGDSLAMLIDTGTNCYDLDKKISRLTDKPLVVVLTHGHYDHSGNIGYFHEIHMHEADRTLDTPALKNYKGRINLIKDGDIFELGGRNLHVVHTPGHTPGSISLVDYDAGLAFTGDAFGSGQLWMQLAPQVSFATLAESCGRIIEIMNEKRITKLYAGHYPFLKRSLGIDYLLDLSVAIRRIDKGDTASSIEFGNDGARLIKYGEAEIVFRPDNSGKSSIIPPVVLLKLDDVHYGEGTDAVPPRWDIVLDYLREKRVKANFGIIGYSLTLERPDYLDWIRDVASKGDIEFWNHGYHNRMSLSEIGEFEQGYTEQHRALHLTDSLASLLVGLKLQAWGPHWTDCNEHTGKALDSVDGLRLIFAHPRNQINFKGIVVPSNLEMEYPYHNPVYKTFLVNYYGKWRNLKSFYLQGHPNAWDESRWGDFELIVERLLADDADFVTIGEYIELVNNHLL